MNTLQDENIEECNTLFEALQSANAKLSTSLHIHLTEEQLSEHGSYFKYMVDSNSSIFGVILDKITDSPYTICIVNRSKDEEEDDD